MTGSPRPSWKKVSVVMTIDLSRTWTCLNMLMLPSTARFSPRPSSWIQTPSTPALSASSRVMADRRRASSQHWSHGQSLQPPTRVSSLPIISPTAMVVYPMTACSTPAFPQLLPVSPWPTVVFPLWGSTHPTCPPKCATSGNLICRDNRSPLPTAQ